MLLKKIENKTIELIHHKDGYLSVEIDNNQFKIGHWYFMEKEDGIDDTDGNLDYLRYRVIELFINGIDGIDDTICHSNYCKSEIIECINYFISNKS